MSETRITLIRYKSVLILLIPATLTILWGLTYVQAEENLWKEMLGLSAIVFGLLGVLIFYVFLYHYQKRCLRNGRHSIHTLFIHVVSVAVMFSVTQWLGLSSPWQHELLWGNYDLRDVCKVMIIGILVVGCISFIGSIYNIFLKDFSQKNYRD